MTNLKFINFRHRATIGRANVLKQNVIFCDMETGSGSMNMQLIRAINKSNKSNNNNNQRSSENKVVIVAPPPRSAGQHKYESSSQAAAPASPSVTLPALKKRTSIVKQSVPPPVPPRGSPRSKSKFISMSRSCRNQKRVAPKKPTMDVDRLRCLSSFEESGCQKVEKWLETVEVPKFMADDRAEASIPEQIEFKSVKKLIQSFAGRDDGVVKNSFVRGQKVFDSSRLVKLRIESYDSLQRDGKNMGKRAQRTFKSSDGGTDSGIDMPARFTSQRFQPNRYQEMHWLSRDGEFV